MKRSFAALLLLAMMLGFAACGGTNGSNTQTVTVQDLTVTLPGRYINLSHNEYADGTQLLYGYGTAVVMADREERAGFEADYPDLNAYGYANMFVITNDLVSTVENRDGLVTFRYEKTVNDRSFTYVCGVYRGKTHFWTVQAYCPTADLTSLESEFMAILKSVIIA